MPTVTQLISSEDKSQTQAGWLCRLDWAHPSHSYTVNGASSAALQGAEQAESSEKRANPQDCTSTKHHAEPSRVTLTAKVHALLF